MHTGCCTPGPGHIHPDCMSRPGGLHLVHVLQLRGVCCQCCKLPGVPASNDLKNGAKKGSRWFCPGTSMARKTRSWIFTGRGVELLHLESSSCWPSYPNCPSLLSWFSLAPDTSTCNPFLAYAEVGRHYRIAELCVAARSKV
eukprot:GHUV01049972.1.p1 GENE.GHUV01049972.1~~GHUV01049972.1.p1  ORF type:complete len:142 (-),score=2.27 GHUV01049972.1:117-542(-)